VGNDGGGKSKITVSTYVNIILYLPEQLLFANKIMKNNTSMNQCELSTYLDAQKINRYKIFKVYFEHFLP
jgi:hypothetical protein